jgi:hypothetical protein
MTTGLREIHLPEDLCASVERKFAQQFATVDELLTFVLSDLLRDDAARLDQAEQRIIEERLKELGYL